jgi:V-type H+-transporting ATPase subunit d
LRGLRSTFLTDVEYANLKEGGSRGRGEKAKEDFEDLRLTLQESDYENFLAAEGALDPKIIATRATAKWVREFKYIRASATGLLARFLDYVAFEYMIDNILDLIKAATSSSGPADLEAVVEGCHPLGLLDPAVMKSILAFEDLGEDFHALYRAILVDTPVGPYFTQFLQDVMDEKAAADPDAVRTAFSEIPMTLIENSIKKLYVEDFYHFCTHVVGGETGAVMGALLETRADLLTINVTYNRCVRPPAPRARARARRPLSPRLPQRPPNAPPPPPPPPFHPACKPILRGWAAGRPAPPARPCSPPLGGCTPPARSSSRRRRTRRPSAARWRARAPSTRACGTLRPRTRGA